MRILIVLCLCSFSTLLSAQMNDSLPSSDSDPRIDNMMNKMDEAFGLAPEQQASLRDIFTRTASQLDAIRPLRSSDRASFRQQRQPIMKQMESEVLAVLDSDQAAQFQAMRQQKRQKRRGRRAGQNSSGEANSVGTPTQNNPNSLVNRSLDYLFEDLLKPAAQKLNER